MASVLVSQDDLSCSICLDLLTSPVTISCGHSFCLNCITGCWDNTDIKDFYKCPQCREVFVLRPALRRNTMLANVVEKLKKTDLLDRATDPSNARPGDVECDFCTGRKLKAVKSCLTCLVSYCKAHIQPHYEVPRFNKHKLVNATSQLQEKICSQHDRMLEVFCCTDQKLICMLCLMDNHNGHKAVSAIAEQTHKQRELLQMKGDNQSQIHQKEKEVEEVKQALGSLQASAQKAADDTERIFTELIRFMEQKRSEVKLSIRTHERVEMSRAEGLLRALKMEILKLKGRDAEIRRLQPVEDPIDFLQRFQLQLSSAPVTRSPPKVTFEPQFSFSKLMQPVVPHLRERIKRFHQALHNVTGFMKGDRVKLKAPEEVCRRNSGYRALDYIKISSEGVITGITDAAVTVDFLEVSAWTGSVSKINLVL